MEDSSDVEETGLSVLNPDVIISDESSSRFVCGLTVQNIGLQFWVWDPFFWSFVFCVLTEFFGVRWLRGISSGFERWLFSDEFLCLFCRRWVQWTGWIEMRLSFCFWWILCELVEFLTFQFVRCSVSFLELFRPVYFTQYLFDMSLFLAIRDTLSQKRLVFPHCSSWRPYSQHPCPGQLYWLQKRLLLLSTSLRLQQVGYRSACLCFTFRLSLSFANPAFNWFHSSDDGEPNETEASFTPGAGDSSRVFDKVAVEEHAQIITDIMVPGESSLLSPLLFPASQLFQEP